MRKKDKAMLFTQIEFIIFFAVVIFILYVLKNDKAKKIVLLASSYYFYAYWDYRFLSLIVFSTTVDYVLGKKMKVVEKQKVRNFLLILSLIANLGLLGFFKYYNFFIESFKVVLEPIGFHLHTLEIILPVGISFYTFQTLSYTIDVYRKKIEPCEEFLDFAVYVGFFPQLVAGPIVRASYFLPQLKKTIGLNLENFSKGFRLFTIGLFKKVFIADNLAMFVDPVFANASAFDWATILLAVIAYSIQIYCDFAGYSDMAIGTGKIMGFDLNINFDWPYLATSIIDFWRRWHISLSSWIRDYIYVSLGGNRRGLARTYANLIIAMLLCGLWHGANWTFVIWGAFHGAGLIVNRVWSSISRTEIEFFHLGEKIRLFAKWLATIIFVAFGWIFFRSPDLSHAIFILNKIITFGEGVRWINPFAVFVVLATASIHFFKALKIFRFIEIPHRAWYAPAMLCSMIWLVVIFYPKEFSPFIYFQF